MIIVHSQAELKAAMDRKEKQITIVGPYAQEVAEKIQRKKKIKKGGMIAGGALAVGGILAAPFTGGTSLAGTVAGASMMGLTIGAITLTTAQLAIILGSGIAAYGIYKGAIIVFEQDPVTGKLKIHIDASKNKS